MSADRLSPGTAKLPVRVVGPCFTKLPDARDHPVFRVAAVVGAVLGFGCTGALAAIPQPGSTRPRGGVVVSGFTSGVPRNPLGSEWGR